MLKKTHASFGDNILNISLTNSWEKLNDKQLKYICYLLVRFDAITAKTYLFIRFSGIKIHKKTNEGWHCSLKLSTFRRVHFYLENCQIQSFIHQLDFIEESNDRPVRLSQILWYKAAHPLLRGVSFQDYITLENLYQGYLHTNNSELLQTMATILYSTQDRLLRIRYTEEERLSVFLWYTSVKNHFSKVFRFFFSPTGEDGGIPNMIEVMNSEIRALTGGDITKENEILNMDCWRALTELNEKARETQEYNAQYGKE